MNQLVTHASGRRPEAVAAELFFVTLGKAVKSKSTILLIIIFDLPSSGTVIGRAAALARY